MGLFFVRSLSPTIPLPPRDAAADGWKPGGSLALLLSALLWMGISWSGPWEHPLPPPGQTLASPPLPRTWHPSRALLGGHGGFADIWGGLQVLQHCLGVWDAVPGSKAHDTAVKNLLGDTPFLKELSFKHHGFQQIFLIAGQVFLFDAGLPQTSLQVAEWGLFDAGANSIPGLHLLAAINAHLFAKDLQTASKQYSIIYAKTKLPWVKQLSDTLAKGQDPLGAHPHLQGPLGDLLQRVFARPLPPPASGGRP